MNSFHNLSSLEEFGVANKIVLYHMHGGESQFREICYVNKSRNCLSDSQTKCFCFSSPKSY